MTLRTLLLSLSLLCGIGTAAAAPMEHRRHDDDNNNKTNNQDDGPDRLAVPVAARGLTIGKHNLLIGAEPGVLLGGDEPVGIMVIPLRFGVTRDFELFAAPIVQLGDPYLHDPSIGGLYRLTHGKAQVGLLLAGDLSLFGTEKTAALRVGVPMRFHLGEGVALEVRPQARIGLVPSGGVGLLLPLEGTWSVTRKFFLGAGSGVQIGDLSAASTSVTVPLSATIGYTIPKKQRPLLDIGVRADWSDIPHAADAVAIVGFGRLYLFP